MSIALLYNKNSLLALIANSDAFAFAEAVPHCNNRFFSIAYKSPNCTVFAEEIVHDVFLTFWNKRASLSENHHSPADLLIEKEYKLLLQNGGDRLPSQQKIVDSLLRDKGLKRDEFAINSTIQPETVNFYISQAAFLKFDRKNDNNSSTDSLIAQSPSSVLTEGN